MLFHLGKCLFESTVRELGEGEMLERTTELWNGCDPKKLDGNGRTKYGMKRLFRSAIDTAECDDYGFPKKEETRKHLEAKFARLEKEQDWTGLSDAQREDPITLAHALTPSVDHCLFNALKLKRALDHLQNDDNDKRRRGNFYWIAKDSKVGFEDDPKGKFWVSQLLQPQEANRFSYEYNIKSPSNKFMFGCGIDPIDTALPDGTKQSSPAMALFRKVDPIIDSRCLNAKKEWERVSEMQTGQFIVTYCHRGEEPSEFYEDMIMMAFYYGTEVLYERNKGAGLREYFKNRGYWGYLAFRPEATKTQWTTDKEPGLPASEGSIEQYIGALKTYIAQFLDNCKHPELIYDGEVGWLTLRNTTKSRQKHDLAVASGIALLHAAQEYVKPQPEEEQNKQEWFTPVDVMAAN